MNSPILNPSIPYFGLIDSDKFAPQKLIRINGGIPQITHRFDITFQCGPSNVASKNDIAVQISVRPLFECVSLNSLRDGMWKEEVCKSPASIKRGEKFEIVVLRTFQEYTVSINGQHYFDFPQRIYYDKISHLRIDGDVSITQISYESVSGSIVCTEFGKLSKVENGFPTAISKFSSPPRNESMHIYSSFPLHDLAQSSCKKPSASIQISSSLLHRNPVTSDVMNSDSHSVQNGKHYFNITCAVFVPVIVFIIIFISFFILWNGRQIYISSCYNNYSSDKQGILNRC